MLTIKYIEGPSDTTYASSCTQAGSYLYVCNELNAAVDGIVKMYYQDLTKDKLNLVEIQPPNGYKFTDDMRGLPAVINNRIYLGLLGGYVGICDIDMDNPQNVAASNVYKWGQVTLNGNPDINGYVDADHAFYGPICACNSWSHPNYKPTPVIIPYEYDGEPGQTAYEISIPTSPNFGNPNSIAWCGRSLFVQDQFDISTGSRQTVIQQLLIDPATNSATLLATYYRPQGADGANSTEFGSVAITASDKFLVVNDRFMVGANSNYGVHVFDCDPSSKTFKAHLFSFAPDPIVVGVFTPNTARIFSDKLYLHCSGVPNDYIVIIDMNQASDLLGKIIDTFVAHPPRTNKTGGSLIYVNSSNNSPLYTVSNFYRPDPNSVSTNLVINIIDTSSA